MTTSDSHSGDTGIGATGQSPVPALEVDYQALIQRALEMHDALPSASASPKDHHEPRSSAEVQGMDFEVELLPKENDRYLAGNFVEGTWVGWVEARSGEREGEQGIYNLALDPHRRTPYALLLPTKDYHPQSAPARPSYLIHAHRILVAWEDAINSRGRDAEVDSIAATDRGDGQAVLLPHQVVAVYDCGERSGAVMGHKCVRLYAARGVRGNFSPTCSSQVPGYLEQYSAFTAKGVKGIYVISVNDMFVMNAWKDKLLGEKKDTLQFAADDAGSLSSALGLVLDAQAIFGGPRFKRGAIVIEDGKVLHVAVEASPADVTVSHADEILKVL